ncbi:amino acid transporter [Salinibacterium sp. CAN_S4]|uniref:APC family permease n=1 Tax=Salinibacterium sp. CAN_S4 TaxID=2787727 RepID=UPI0018EFF955
MNAPRSANALRRAIDNPPPVVGVGTESSVTGLDRRSVGFADVLAQSVSAVAPSAAATTVPIMVAVAAGSASVWAIAAAMLLCAVVASTVNQFTRRLAAAGSLYTFVAKGLGTTASSVTGVAMIIGYGVIAMFALTGAGLYLSFLLDQFAPEVAASGLVVPICILATGALCFFVLARGIRLSTRVTMLVESVSVVLIVVLVVALLAVQPAGIDGNLLNPTALLSGTVSIGDFAAGAMLAITAFVGFESSAALGVEARRPFAAIPRAVLWTVMGAGLLYLLSTYSQLVGFETLGRDIGSSTSPVNELASAYGIEWVGILLDASIATSFFACAIASTTALTRVLFSMGREGLLPNSLGHASATNRTPIVAIAAVLPVLVGVPIWLIATGGSVWFAMGILIVGAASGYVVAYILLCIAAPVFLWRIGELTLWPAIKAAVGAAGLTAVLVAFLISEGATAQGGAMWAFLVLMVVGSAGILVLRTRRPWLHQTIGMHDETVLADVLGGDRQPEPL